MDRAAMIDVLGAIAYGELGAYRGARARAEAEVDEAERSKWQAVAAQELRHYRGFVARLETMGADPEAAMARFRPALDAYRSVQPSNEVEGAVWSYLGEGIADDLLVWFESVVDHELRSFVASVIADEVEHEGDAAAHVRAVIAADAANQNLARAAAQAMVDNMLASAGGPEAVTNSPLLAFLRIGRGDDLVRGIMRGFARRLQAIGIDPGTIRTPFAGPLPG